MKKLKKTKNAETFSERAKVLEMVEGYEFGFFVTLTPSYVYSGVEGVYGKQDYDNLLKEFMDSVEIYLFGKNYKRKPEKILYFIFFKEFGYAGALQHYHIHTLKNKYVTKKELIKAVRQAADRLNLRKDCVWVKEIYNSKKCIKYCMKEWRNPKKYKNQCNYTYIKNPKFDTTSNFSMSNILLDTGFITPEKQKKLLQVKVISLNTIKKMIKSARNRQPDKTFYIPNRILFKALWDVFRFFCVIFILQYGFYKGICTNINTKTLNEDIAYLKKWRKYFRKHYPDTKIIKDTDNIWRCFSIEM